MGIVKNIETKIKINQRTSMIITILSFITVFFSFLYSYQLIKESRKSIYILDNGVPVFVKQTDLLLNRPVEYKSQIDLFHSLFFTLTPDDDFIKSQTKKALYLIDDSGMKEYVNLKEKSFYNQVISSNSIMTIKTDSIKLNAKDLKFTYFGTQTIERKTQLIIRKLITEGYVQDIPRSENNPHGVLIKNWKTLDNSDLSIKTKFR